MAKKALAVAVLVIFCLTVMLFMAIPTRSSLGAGDYDPWCDIDESGEIDIVDISKIAISFEASGDPTKSVVIAGHAIMENATSFFLNSTENLNFTIQTAGYKTATFSVYAQSWDAHQFEIFLGQKIAGKYSYTTTQMLTSDSTIHVVKPTWYENINPATIVLTFEVTFSELVLSINNISIDEYLKGTIAYYLSN